MLFCATVQHSDDDDSPEILPQIGYDCENVCVFVRVRVIVLLYVCICVCVRVLCVLAVGAPSRQATVSR